jgi:AraC-like DNA-binding protein
VTAIGKPRGVLRGAPAEGAFRHERHPPPDVIAGFVEHFWLVAWQVTGEPVTREVLSHPSVHIVLERGRSSVTGVPRGRFVRRLEGQGEVFGIKFRPGGFRPLARGPVAQLTDRTIPLGELFPDAAALEHCVLSAAPVVERIALASAFLRRVLPARDPVVDHVAAVVKRILDDRGIRRVDDVVRIVGGSPRALQRLFSDYVGVSPKWVIRRYRLHDAIERMDAGDVVDWPSLALELGYFDQAHFIREFKSLVGRTPGDYGVAPSRAARRVARL